MSYLLHNIKSKAELDDIIRSVKDVVLVLRFGKDDSSCLHIDNIFEKTAPSLSNMAKIYTVDTDSIPEYVEYFDISLIPATVFFFNAQHIKVDWGTVDNTKFIGSFKTKQDFIDVIEIIYKGAMKGKVKVNSPLDPKNVAKYELVYKDI